MKFTFESYIQLIELLKTKGYIFTNYFDYEKYNKCVILRHDIDMDINKAMEIAKIESQIGVHSTYFVLLSSDFYNIFSKDSITLLNAIKSMGHDIGLHFDETKYFSENDEFDEKDIEEKILFEIDILSKILNTEINCVSYHRPSKKALKMQLNLGSVINTYSRTFFSDFKYVSDSHMTWREPIMDYIRDNKFPRFQILTHPIWYNKIERNIHDVLFDFVESANQKYYNILNNNIKGLNKIVGDYKS